ncbi:MAG: c-type cytochrome, partial [Longimicrobiales bacterium]
MVRRSIRSWWFRATLALFAISAPVVVVAAFTSLKHEPVSQGDPVLRGRQLVKESACGDCHGGPDAAAAGWLAGIKRPDQEFLIGPCAFEKGAQPCFRTRPRNLTPDNETGLGKYSERQIFNALRYGLRPGETPDIEITSHTPGKGNFPAQPKYLAPPMPWTAWRHMPDEDLKAIAAYLKRGLKPVSNKVKDSEAPPDFWAGGYHPDSIGPVPVLPFPTQNEIMPQAGTVDIAKVRRGRQVVIQHDCGACHGGGVNPAKQGWLAGTVPGPFESIPIGACATEPGAQPCFLTRPRNLTPDNLTGMGRFSERQIFNSLRYGLRPGETEDVEITSSTPGQGNFPEEPKYLAPPMPWAAWRHMTDADLWAIAAYLKHGLKPVRNKVKDSDG